MRVNYHYIFWQKIWQCQIYVNNWGITLETSHTKILWHRYSLKIICHSNCRQFRLPLKLYSWLVNPMFYIVKYYLIPSWNMASCLNLFDQQTKQTKIIIIITLFILTTTTPQRNIPAKVETVLIRTRGPMPSNHRSASPINGQRSNSLITELSSPSASSSLVSQP